MIQFSVTIPQKISMNIVRGMNWKKWNRLAELYHGEVLELKGKLKVVDYPVDIRYDYFWTKKPLDSLNSALMCKLIEDGLVHAKVLEDDDPTHVRESTLSTRISQDYQHDTVVITITKSNG